MAIRSGRSPCIERQPRSNRSRTAAALRSPCGVPASSFELHRRRVQQLGDDALGHCLDRGSLRVVERRQPSRESLELGPTDCFGVFVQLRHQRRRLASRDLDDEALDLLGDDLADAVGFVGAQLNALAAQSRRSSRSSSVTPARLVTRRATSRGTAMSTISSGARRRRRAATAAGRSRSAMLPAPVQVSSTSASASALGRSSNGMTRPPTRCGELDGAFDRCGW